MEKRLGKIQRAYFGIGGYQDACIGLNVTLGDGSWGVTDSKTAWDSSTMKRSDRCQWTEADRSKQYDEIVRYVSDLLNKAKVSDVSKLVGVPVEVEFDGMCLKSWRILTEVL